MRTTLTSRVTGFAVTMVAATGLVACSSADSPTRSTANFCSTYNTEKAKYQKQYAGASAGTSDDFGSIMQGLALGLQSLGDVSVILEKLDRVAPEEIEPDVAAVRDSWKSMQGSLGDEAASAFKPTGMLGAMFRGLLTSMLSNGSWTRVGDFVQQHCS